MKIERFLSKDDAAALSRLAEQLTRVRGVRVSTADTLNELVATSRLLPVNDVQSDYVTLNSAVTCRLVGTEDYRTVLVPHPPGFADDAQSTAAAMASQAVALFGRRVGSIVEMSLSFNYIQYVEIVEVVRLPCEHSKSVDCFTIHTVLP